MYECDKGYTIRDTGVHHPNDLYDGDYVFDSPGIYYNLKRYRGNLYKMEIAYDSEQLGILLRFIRRLTLFSLGYTGRQT